MTPDRTPTAVVWLIVINAILVAAFLVWCGWTEALQ